MKRQIAVGWAVDGSGYSYFSVALNTFKKQFYGYLLPNGYVERVSRGIYKISQKGEKLLEILT